MGKLFEGIHFNSGNYFHRGEENVSLLKTHENKHIKGKLGKTWHGSHGKICS